MPFDVRGRHFKGKAGGWEYRTDTPGGIGCG